MTDLADTYRRITALYHRQLDLLADDEPDGEALAELVAAVDSELIRLPPSDRLPALARAQAEQLAAAAREADALRARAAARIAELRDTLARSALREERAASAVRAYEVAVTPPSARFVDQKR